MSNTKSKPLMSMRKRWLGLILLLILVPTLVAVGLFARLNDFSMQIQNAANYLRSHFNETIGLVYESEDTGLNKNAPGYWHNQTYYIYSDNILAELALKPHEPEMSTRIGQTINSYGLPPNDFFEVLFGSKISEPLCNGQTNAIATIGDSIILAEFRNYSSPIQGEYADAMIYRSLNCYLKGDMDGAKQNFNATLSLWDGKGIYDDAAKNESLYANYKLALILYGSKILNISINPAIEQKLWSMQQPNGGIISKADLSDNPVGSANAETTSMALLSYNSQLIKEMQALFGKGTMPPISRGV